MPYIRTLLWYSPTYLHPTLGACWLEAVDLVAGTPHLFGFYQDVSRMGEALVSLTVL